MRVYKRENKTRAKQSYIYVLTLEIQLSRREGLEDCNSLFDHILFYTVKND